MDGHGAPFLPLGSSTWVFPQLSREEIDARFDDVAACGFNAVVLMTLSGGPDDGVNPSGSRAQYGPPQAYGLFPFTDNKLTPSVDYFTHLRDIVRRARARGLVAYVSACYRGHDSSHDGFQSRVEACTDQECADYGDWLGTFFKDEPNLIWVMGGDSLPDTTPRVKWTALGEAILAADPGRLMTGHTARTGEGKDYGSYINLNSVYRAWNDIVAGTIAAGSALKIFYEGTYFGDGTAFGNPDDFPVSKVYPQSYHAILSGCAGANQGDHETWTAGYVTPVGDSPPPVEYWPDWRDSLTNAAAQTNKWTKKFFESFAWWTLLDAGPDSSHAFVTSGLGSGETAVAASYTSLVGAAIYFDDVTLALGVFSGAVRIRTYDPTTGDFSTLEASIANSGTYDVTHTNNAAGTAPRLLLVEVI